MKLKLFTPENTPSRADQTPCVLISGKKGRMRFKNCTAPPVELGEYITICFDEDTKMDWYIGGHVGIVDKKDLFPLRKEANNSGLLLQNKTLAQMILKSAGLGVEATALFRIAKASTSTTYGALYAILTAQPVTVS